MFQKDDQKEEEEDTHIHIHTHTHTHKDIDIHKQRILRIPISHSTHTTTHTPKQTFTHSSLVHRCVYIQKHTHTHIHESTYHKTRSMLYNTDHINVGLKVTAVTCSPSACDFLPHSIFLNSMFTTTKIILFIYIPMAANHKHNINYLLQTIVKVKKCFKKENLQKLMSTNFHFLELCFHHRHVMTKRNVRVNSLCRHGFHSPKDT